MPRMFRGLNFVLAGTLCLLPLMSLAATPRVPATAPKTPAALTEEQRVLHVLNRLGYGPRPGDVERVRRMGLRQYVAQQLQPATIDDSALHVRLKRLSMLDLPTADMVRIEAQAREMRQALIRRNQGSAPERPGEALSTLSPDERRQMMERYREAFGDGKRAPYRMVSDLQEAKLLRAVYSERQLQEVMTDFWFNHFNVFAGKNLVRVFINEYEREAIRPHALGRFEDLLRATAQSPAMLFYLDNWQSVTPDVKLPGRGQRPPDAGRPGSGQMGQAPRGQGRIGGRLGQGGIFNRGGQRPFPPPPTAGPQPERPGVTPGAAQRRQPGINENYARELLELHTLGVDGGYTQKDVQEVARCFTGWSIHQPFGGQRRNRFGGLDAPDLPPGSFIYRDWAHDQGEKIVLGTKIPAGGGKRDGELVLTLLARHPSTAKFIATKLCRRFVADEPPASLVAAVAATFERTQGDIRACLQTLFDDPAFFAPETYRAKVKTPLEFVASTLRATNADITDAQALIGALARLGMPLYGCQPPTGYKDVAEAWVNTGALLNRLNFALALSSGNLPGIKVSTATPNAGSEAVVDTLLNRYVGGDVSDTTRQALLDVVADPHRLKVAKPTPAETDLGLAEDADDDDAPAEPRRGRMASGGKAFGPGTTPAIRRYDRAIETLSQAGMPLPLTAQLTGLVLGSPEFQRR
ncbi:DUF1800 domain-containing protein [Chloracidobacterium validum]|uniref:DUF1800 domain-containing protein n=1 Tax=Chloracidobacterium validum TaxID=2821543 RepID=A0ABX8BE35_9BACT|nr:DUF1800 domain-containing protein [Chloracidobacterium validum]QUW03330.1 DUF1800 domain-containing protein [Chloracidobacterium validum]